MKKIATFLIIFVFLFPLCGCKQSSLPNSVYEITAEYLESGVISAHLRFQYVCNIKEGTDTLKFNLFPNAFREDAQVTPVQEILEKYGEINIISVKMGDSDLNYSICGSDMNILQVFLGEIICYGEKTTIDIVFGDVLPSGNYRYSVGVDTVNIGNWYPVLCVYENGAFVECEYGEIGDPFYSEVADFKVTLVVPSKMVVSGSGVATSCDVEGDKTAYSYELTSARDFAFCLSEKFNILSEKCGSVTVNYYFYDDDEPEKTLEAVTCALSYFSENFGDYPFSQFSVAECDFREGGMEYTGLVYVSDELNSYNRLISAVHETAHQWWFGVVGNNQLDEAYLDEGLTEYSTAIFFDENAQFGIDASQIFENARKSCSHYEQILNALGVSSDYQMVKNLKNFDGELEYVNTAYNLPLTMMRSAENKVGREKIKTLLAKYYKNNKFKIANTDIFLQTFSPVREILSAYIEGRAVL